VHLAGRDRRGDAAVERRLQEVYRPLTRGEVAEHGMNVGVDETRHDGGATGVDHGVGVLVEAPTHTDDDPFANDERVGVEERAADLTADELTDVVNERLHRKASLAAAGGVLTPPPAAPPRVRCSARTLS
jgi:hypothetical protein